MRKIMPANLLWKSGRFSWPFVVVVAYLAFAVFLFDLMWRVTKWPFAEFVEASAAAFAVSSVLLSVAIKVASRSAAT